MRQLSVLSGLVLTSICLAAPQHPQEPLYDADLTGLEMNDSPDNFPNNSTMTLDELVEMVFHRSYYGPSVYDSTTEKNEQTNDGAENPVKPNDCQCVPYYQCHHGWIIDDGSGLIDKRSENLNRPERRRRSMISASSRCESSLEICCKLGTKISTWEENECGWRRPDGLGPDAIGDSAHARFGEFPWMTAILSREKFENSSATVNVYRCGGALIHPQAVLTAAGCVFGRKLSKLECRVGVWKTRMPSEIYPHQDRNVSKVIIHEDYVSQSLHNNFAILILSSPIELAENVNTVCLPWKNDLFDDSRCFATGWGKDVFGSAGRYPTVLKKIELSVVPRPLCQNYLRATRLGRYFNLHSSFICAGGEPDKDMCLNDGGGPLVCPVSRNGYRYALAGIVSWGIGCGERGIPGVYANVAGARKWIDAKMALNNLDIAAYTH